MRKRQILAGAGAAALAMRLRPALAQSSFPNAPIRLVVPFPPAGTTDIFARIFAERFGRELGQGIVVENRGGAGGLIGGAEVARARPDGHTLIFHSPTSGVTGPLTRRVPPYDPVTGFAHVAILGITPIVLAVSPRLGVRTLTELVAMIRAKPGELSYGSSGIGGGPHLSAELLRVRAGGLDMVHVPYRGAAPAIQDVLAGNLSFMVDTFTPLLPMHRDGQLRIISVFGTERAAVAPDIPTAREEGLDLVTRIANYLSAPPGTPADRLERLGAAARAVMSSPEMRRELEGIAYVPITDSGPEHARRFIAEEAALWAPVIRAANIEIE
ncbi:Bug family tripartite tricarboxylate transporter substrate binding protein [Roseicella aerolata]|uniref:Tripartite tricarboxylate transporter substrate binding protein n=1 Tax=Roseicella aerolata TaxID=2883479 RepID=A0A9X1LAH8_9PROT|nr:tripartite tricarboxylate transporter substrate binding protein [Roseicella aerolata]MCB4821437.1 tripartite tricarboxylate transporter substrate binding protein [Roseicella aerolata]